MKKPFLMLAAALALIVAASTFLAYRVLVKSASLTVANNSPTKIMFATYCQPTKDSSVVSEWHVLNAGEHKTFKQRFWRVEPNFAVFAHSADPELVRSLRKLSPNDPATLYYDGDLSDDVITFQAVKGNDFFKPERTGTNIFSTFVASPFVKVPVNPESQEAAYPIRDKWFKGLYDLQGVSSPAEEIAVFSARARLLSSVLQRQMKFEKTWPNTEGKFPYRLGLAIDDYNDRYMPGVLIYEAAPMTIFGDEMPFRAGDILFSFAGHPVFSISDLHLSLYEHATSFEKGIYVPVQFEVIRNGQRLKGQTLYFFNEAYWGYSTSDRSSAFVYGFGDGVTLGHSVQVSTGLKNAGKLIYNFFRSKNSAPAKIEDFKKEVWEGNQFKARLRQMYAKEFDAGSFLGMFCPGPGWPLRGPLRGTLTRAGASRIIASLAAAATIEMAEGVIWTVADSSPLRTPGQIANDLKVIVPLLASSQAAFATLRLRRPR